MKSIYKIIPSVFTLSNLFVGVVGILVFQHNIILSSICVFIAIFFDFFDGFIAKRLKATSDFGKELDSLSDIVSFGVLPACILFASVFPDFIWYELDEIPLISLVILSIPLFSALRLAKFNIDSSQTKKFKGLPTPATALLIASIPFILTNNNDNSIGYIVFSEPNNIYALAILLSLLMVIPIPLISLKFSNISLKNNLSRYILIILSVVLFVFYKWSAIPLTIILYFFISIIDNIFNKNIEEEDKKPNDFNFYDSSSY